jgi:hypothetical protein
VDERQGEVEPAFHPARVTGDSPVGRVGEPDALEQFPRAGLGDVAPDAVQRRLNAQMLAAGEHLVQRDIL